MKLSYNWLNDFVDLKDLDPYKLAEELTMKAFEVEDIESTGLEIDEKVVLGEILEINKHPDADKLNVTQTSIGSETLQIVCGGRNIKVGQKVPVALVGASVTNRHDGTKLDIKKSKIRGVESLGMLCSADELGMSQEEALQLRELQGDGIYLFADPSNPNIKDITEGAALGTAINKILNKNSDYILEVGARSNRGDALSVFGQAREISAVFRKNLQKPKAFTYHADKTIKTIQPRIAASSAKDCSLFYTVTIENIKVTDSPKWLTERLSAQGQKSINNIVDVSNFVMLELGQPMHCYDREKIHGEFLEVRRAKPGEKITTLEEKTYELEEINLVIADSNGPCSLAGVMGGLDCSISEQTQNIVIEVAIFNSATVRKSARAAGVESESKRRFERGVDKALARTSLMRAIAIINEISSDIKISEIAVTGDETLNTSSIKLRKNQIKRFTGIDIDEKTIVDILERLEIKVKQQDAESFEFEIPSHRENDLRREIDLIEELIRVYGYDQIKVEAPSSGSKSNEIQDAKSQKEISDKVSQSLLAYGFSEAKLSSLIGDSLLGIEEKLNLKKTHIEMDHPLSVEHKTLRQSLIPGLIQAASRNYSYDRSIDIKLFELGKVYHYQGDLTKANRDLCKEESRVAAIYIKNSNNWLNQKSSTLGESFFFLKSLIEELYPRAKFKTIEPGLSYYNLVHPGISAIVEEDKREIGFIAKLHPSISKEWDLPEETYILELNFPKKQEIKFKAISSTPIIERDITVDSSETVNAQEIIDLIKKHCAKDLQKVSITSLYKRAAENTQSNNKSTTFRLKFQSAADTLSGEEIDKQIASLKLLLESSLRVTFRA